MNILLDTHAFLWWITDDAQLSATARTLIRDSENQIESLPITDRYAFQAGRLPRHHKDPFDRMLIAQAVTDSLVLLSCDSFFDLYDVRVMW